MWIKRRFRHLDRAYTKGRFFLFWHGAGLSTYRHVLRTSRHPILIGGCGRSGTTLLLSLLSAHPNVYAVPHETQAFTPGAYPPEGEISLDGDFHIDFLFSHFLRDDVDLTGVDRWCEKTPMNVHFFDQLVEYFGEGLRFINVVRDGRDVITSHHPEDPTSYWVTPDRWIRDVSAGRQFEGHPQFKTITYERLTTNPTDCLRALCEFLGEEYSPRFEEYPDSATITNSNAWFGEAQKVQRRSEKRWTKDVHRPVVETLLDRAKAVEHLEHYGYIDSSERA
jgi:hypothetical protein